MNTLKRLVKSVLESLKLFSFDARTRKEAFDVVFLSRLRVLDTDSQVFKKGVALGAVNPRRIILFSHFDSRSVIDPYVQYYLDFLSLDIDAYFFVISTSAELKNDTDILTHPRCLGILKRANFGLDFSSWKAGFKILKKRGINFNTLHSVTLANDSCFGPLVSLRKYFDLVEAEKLPVMGGITESFSFARHLQSYFIVLNGAALQIGFLEKFFQKVRPIASKSALIRRYEVGMGVLAAQLGVALWPLLRPDHLKAALLNEPDHAYSDFFGANSTVLHWDILLRDRLSPFLKKSVFLEQPSDFAPPGFSGWRQAIAAFSSYPVGLIESYAKVFGERTTFSATQTVENKNKGNP
jgi:lipopolysaccharide biosynthesis protein